MASTPAISLRGLTKTYGRKRGVEDVTFDVMPGEVMGFLGPNGSGKTTTMRVLLGLLKITRGSAEMLGVNVANAPPASRARVGYLPGTLALYKNLSAGEFLHFAARMRRQDCSHQIATLAERFDLNLDTHIHDLSKGNRQKVGVIQAFMHDPTVLILDEPTSGLDPLVQREFDLLLKEVCGRGAAVLLSSHVLSEAEYLAHRVAILNQGRLLTVDDIDQLKAKAVRTVVLDFPQPVPIERFAQLSGISDVSVRGRQVDCTVHGSETEMLRTAVEFGVTGVRTAEPNLDDIFWSLVSGGDGHVVAAVADQDLA